MHKNGRRDITRRYVLGDVQSEDMFINGMGFLVSILYTHNVVGGVVNCTGVIYGVRTSLFLTSQRMPSRYGGVHEHLQLYKRNNYIYVNVIIYVYIRTHRWLYVVITTKFKHGRHDTQNRRAAKEDNLIIIFLFIYFSKYFLDFFIFKLYHSLFSLCVG